MTPPGLYKGKKSISPPRREIDWIKWVPLWTVVGGVIASFASLQLHQRDLGLGLGWESVFASVNFYSLKILTEKVLSRSTGDAKKYFWFWNTIRWAVSATVCWLFLRVSPLCLGGAAISYFWFLLVLGLVGWRSSSSLPNQKQL